MAATTILGDMFPRMAIRSAQRSMGLRSSMPIARNVFSAQRSISTASKGPLSPPSIAARSPLQGFLQQRSLFGSSWGASANRNMLAHLEQLANNNPGSATAQNAFYSALLRSNMPEILVERYNTGRFASNAACENVFKKALQQIGAAESGVVGNMAGQNAQGIQGNGSGMSAEQLQAVGQAVAAKYTGGNVGINMRSQSGSGNKAEPLYVVVDESMFAFIFRIVKFVLLFCACGYAFLVVFTLIVESLGFMKKGAAGKDAETKPELQTTRFSDVHGCDEAKEELQELVDFLKSPESFSTLGGKMPKGVLLTGPPGTGKTLLARAVAGEAQVPFFYMSGSEFDEVYVGVGAKRVRELFANARTKSPAIIFIDELDAVGSKRHERDAAYAKQTLNQLLTELDGFEQNSGVIIIGATNFPESLDKALTRPGRFDRNVAVSLPDVRGRIAILKHHLRNIKFDVDVDASVIARGSPGMSGAELESIVNQAAVHASKRKATQVSLEDMVWAKDKIMMGAERKSAVIQQKDKIMTAYHEGGHALVALLTEGCDPLYKATIMPRGHALGITFQLPEMDKVSETKKNLEARIDVCMGGKVAEQLIYGDDGVSTGASSDIQQATNLAYHMVTQAGMSDLLGNIDLSSNYNRLSTDTKQKIEGEVRRIIEAGKDRATKLLTEKRTELDRLATALVEYETLDKAEMEKVIRGEPLPNKLKSNPDTPIKLPTLPMPPPFGVPPAIGGSIGGEGASDPEAGDESRPYPAASS
jgi:ATP-dependent metalloprotease